MIAQEGGITISEIAAGVSIFLGLVGIATLLIRQGKFIKHVDNMNDRLKIVETKFLSTSDNELLMKSCRSEVFRKMDKETITLTKDVSTLKTTIVEVKESVKKICKENIAYRKESTERWMKTNEILHKLEGALDNGKK